MSIVREAREKSDAEEGVIGGEYTKIQGEGGLEEGATAYKMSEG